ncbi:hypothetical protein SETIT_2G059400v2 [Setaria italica]|uniref:CRIB domain-containing protein n=1 Tax=Setaria italica TaxID=4555 RepID=A0A368PVK0_SETIT|nr:hypothetical protein SETIT_2G059400v2 [Setaria italica]
MGSEDVLPDAILELVLLRLDSPLCLRAASTCKRWRRIIASDAFRALHGSPHAVAGSYYNKDIFVRPRFDPSPANVAAAVDGRHFSLDFVPGDDKSSWTVNDSRGSLLLLDREDCRTGRSDLIVCEPLTRRHVMIPPPKPDAAYFATAVLLDGDADADADEHVGSISMSNFRHVIHIGSTWFCFKTGCDTLLLHCIGVAARQLFWHERRKKVVALDQNTLEFSSFVLPDRDIIKATPTVGRDGEARIVVDEIGSKLKIFARLGGGSGEVWALEKTTRFGTHLWRQGWCRSGWQHRGGPRCSVWTWRWWRWSAARA